MQLTDRESERIARAICDFYKLDPKEHVIQITGDGPKRMTYLEWAKDGIANTLKVLDMCGYTLSSKAFGFVEPRGFTDD